MSKKEKNADLESVIDSTVVEPKDMEVTALFGTDAGRMERITWGKLWSLDGTNYSRESADYGNLEEFAKTELAPFGYSLQRVRAPMVVRPMTDAEKASAIAERAKWLESLPAELRAVVERVIGDDTPIYRVSSGHRRFKALPYAFSIRALAGKDSADLHPTALIDTRPLSRSDERVENLASNLDRAGAKGISPRAMLRNAVELYKAGTTDAKFRLAFGTVFRGQQMLAIARIIVQGPARGAVPWKDTADFFRRISLAKDDPDYLDISGLTAGSNKETLRKAALVIDPSVKRPSKPKGEDGRTITIADAMGNVRRALDGQSVKAQRGLSKDEWQTLADRNPEERIYRFLFSFVSAKEADREAYVAHLREHRDSLNAVVDAAPKTLLRDDDDE